MIEIAETRFYPRYATRDVDEIHSVIDIFDDAVGGYVEYDTTPNFKDIQTILVRKLNEEEPPAIYHYE